MFFGKYAVFEDNYISIFETRFKKMLSIYSMAEQNIHDAIKKKRCIFSVDVFCWLENL